MPCSHCQEPLVGLANKPNSVPNQWAWVMASGWLPKPSLKDMLNQEGLVTLVPSHLHQYHSISVIKTCLHDQQTSQYLLNDEMYPDFGPWPVHQEWGWVPQWGQDWGQRQQEVWTAPPQSPSLSSDHRFKSDWSSASTSSLVSLMFEIVGGSRHSHCGWWPYREPRGHMKINLPVFKDEDTKDTVTYQSWCWDLTVYHCMECWDYTLLPYVICSLQGYLGELVRSSGTDITLDDVLTMLDEHYNNVKALDALKQELFQLQMGKNRQCQVGKCACWDTSRFSQYHSWNVSLWTM